MRERLQKILARAGHGSRRHNESLIEAGRVTVNGEVASLGATADLAHDIVAVDGNVVQVERPVYIMLNKPRDVLSSTEDEMDEGRATVRDLVDVEGHLYPVGRLDRNSEGLILLTNDGYMAHRLTHPRYEHTKTYRITVHGTLTEAQLRQWRNGVMLDEKKTVPAQIEVVRRQGDVAELLIVMREGRKRQIRRVAALLGLSVSRLVREKIGPLELSGVAPGEWRYLTPGELNMIRRELRRGEDRSGEKKQGRVDRGGPPRRGRGRKR